MPKEWKRLVTEAMDDDISFEKLIVRLEPILYHIARSLVRDSMVEDLVQLARIQIWQGLPRVSVKREGTIRQFLVKVGENTMKDYLRCNKRFNNNHTNVDEIDVVVDQPIQTAIFKGLLGEYVNYIRLNSTFAGSHQFLAAKYGVSPWVMRGRFHNAVGEFLKR